MRHALNHVVSAVEPDGDAGRSPSAEAFRRREAAAYEHWVDVATAVLDRADKRPWAGEVLVSDAEWLALIECLYDAAEYMAQNHYADDEDFPEDAAASRLFTEVDGGPGVFGLEICWHKRPDAH